jgi:hypothetical protein
MFILHLVISVAVSIAGFLIAGALETIRFRYTNYVLFSYGLPIIILNLIASYLVCRKISFVGARWVWMPLALFIARFAVPLHGQPLGEGLSYMWVQTFSPNCGASECLGEIFLGAPFLGAVAYAVMSAFVRWDSSRAAAQD